MTRGSTLAFLRRALRFDGLWWRKFAYLGSVYGPEWWKRWSPPWIAAIIFLCVPANRRGAVQNMQRVLGKQGFWRDHWNALKVFISFAHCFNESLEYLSPHRKPVTITTEPPTENDDPSDPIRGAMVDSRGAILVTCHFGNWDVAVRRLSGYGAGINVVMARETNDTTAEYMRRAREEAGVRVLLSDTSVYSTFNILRALRRNEVVAMQLDRPLGGEGARAVPFFGAPALFQSGALRLARLANAPVLPAFVARLAPREYCIVLGTERRVPRHATQDDIDAILAGIVAEFEALVRRFPEQWFQFQPFWPAPGDVPVGTSHPAPHPATTTRSAASRRSSV